MTTIQLWCRVTVVGRDGDRVARWDLWGRRDADLESVAQVARLALWVRRGGAHLTLADVSPALRALLELAALGVEVEGETEVGKEPLGVQEGQEERHRGDATP